MAGTTKAKTASLPSIIDILAGYGVATDEAIRRLENLKAKFPTGEVPIEFVINIARNFLDGAVQDAILKAVTADFMALLTTGKGPIRRDPSALA